MDLCEKNKMRLIFNSCKDIEDPIEKFFNTKFRKIFLNEYKKLYNTSNENEKIGNILKCFLKSFDIIKNNNIVNFNFLNNLIKNN